MWQEFLAFLSGIGHVIFAFMMAGAQSIASNGGPVLVQAAEDGVAAAEAAGGDGATKRAAALAAVIADLQKNGIPVVINAVNVAIETSVANLRAKQAATPAA